MRGSLSGFALLTMLAAASARPIDVEQDDLRPGLVAQYRSLSDTQAPLTRIDPNLPFHLSQSRPPALAREARAGQGRACVRHRGCVRGPGGGFPGVRPPPPGPSLADAARRINRAWLLQWLEDPVKVRADAHMPVLFSADRNGFV